MAPRPIPDQAYLLECLYYDPATGIFHWKQRPPHHFRTHCSQWNGEWAGRQAGCLLPSGYMDIGLDGRHYRAHRVAWVIMTGEWPEAHIDHINMNRADNRFENLRQATHGQNLSNSRMRRNNTSGFKGAYLAKDGKRWRSQIAIDGKMRSLGHFSTPEEAHAAFVEAAKQRHGEFWRPE